MALLCSSFCTSIFLIICPYTHYDFRDRNFECVCVCVCVRVGGGNYWQRVLGTMAPRTAASVCWCAMFCLVLLVNSVFCLKTGSSFTREMLMNIRVITPDNLLPTFIASSVDILDILVKGALTFV